MKRDNKFLFFQKSRIPDHQKIYWKTSKTMQKSESWCFLTFHHIRSLPIVSLTLLERSSLLCFRWGFPGFLLPKEATVHKCSSKWVSLEISQWTGFYMKDTSAMKELKQFVTSNSQIHIPNLYYWNSQRNKSYELTDRCQITT